MSLILTSEARIASDERERARVLIQTPMLSWRVKSVRLYVAWAASFTYAMHFDDHVVCPSDSRDHQHSILASAADVFVTHDRKLRKWLKRIPNLPIEVTTLLGLLKAI